MIKLKNLLIEAGFNPSIPLAKMPPEWQPIQNLHRSDSMKKLRSTRLFWNERPFVEVDQTWYTLEWRWHDYNDEHDLNHSARLQMRFLAKNPSKYEIHVTDSVGNKERFHLKDSGTGNVERAIASAKRLYKQRESKLDK